MLLINYYLVIIMIIITKSHNNYCSVGVMELCLLNLLILVDCFCVILTLVSCLRVCHMWLTRNHMFIRETWGKFTLFIFWNLPSFTREISNFQESELSKFIPNFSLKHVITSKAPDRIWFVDSQLEDLTQSCLSYIKMGCRY